MIEFFKRILWDESAFERYARAAVMAFAVYATSEGWISKELGALLAGGGLLIPAGQKNPDPKQLQ